MNKGKIIKDLKERNDKLSNQYRLRDIRCVHLEQENTKLRIQISAREEVVKELEDRINKIEHYINCHAIDFDDGRWCLELTEMQLNELIDVIKGRKE